MPIRSKSASIKDRPQAKLIQKLQAYYSISIEIFLSPLKLFVTRTGAKIT